MDTQVLERKQLLERELNRYLQLLKQSGDLSRVILFGSLATGEVHSWSDIDLIIIKSTALPFLRRLQEVRQLLQPRVGTDVLVYTPQEFQQLLRERLFFQTEILTKGIVVNEPERWLAFASEDFRVAEILLQEQIYNQVCFHAQQCVEKALKGVLMHQGHIPPRTHAIVDLLSLLPDDFLSEQRTMLYEMDIFYLSTRYPDVLPATSFQALPGKNEAEAFVTLARTVLEQAWQLIQHS